MSQQYPHCKTCEALTHSAQAQYCQPCLTERVRASRRRYEQRKREDPDWVHRRRQQSGAWYYQANPHAEPHERAEVIEHKLAIEDARRKRHRWDPSKNCTHVGHHEYSDTPRITAERNL